MHMQVHTIFVQLFLKIIDLNEHIMNSEMKYKNG